MTARDSGKQPASQSAGRPSNHQRPPTPAATSPVARRFETVFGANRQNQDVSKANVGEFAGDIANAATKAFAGQAQ